MQIAKKEGNVFVGFSTIERFLIDAPEFQAQTNDLLEALVFLAQHGCETDVLIDGFGPDTRELDWRDMVPRVCFQSCARH